MNTKLSDMTPEQHGAMALLAMEHGGRWRGHLKHLWSMGIDDTIKAQVGNRVTSIGGLLRQVRNTFGPKGIDQIQLADVAQVFEIDAQLEGRPPYYRFNGWFSMNPVMYDEIDRRILDTLPVGSVHFVKQSEGIITLAIKRMA